MKRLISFGFLGAFLAITLVACGPSPREIAKSQAISGLVDLRSNPQTGDGATAKVNIVRVELATHKIPLVEVGTSDAELNKFIRLGHHGDAKTLLGQLNGTHASPEEAVRLRTTFLDHMAMARDSYADYAITRTVLDQLVARNGLEFTQRSGAKVTPAMYEAAGLPVAKITKTHTIIKRMPAKPKPVARRVTKMAPIKKIPAHRSTKPVERVR